MAIRIARPDQEDGRPTIVRTDADRRRDPVGDQRPGERPMLPTENMTPICSGARPSSRTK